MDRRWSEDECDPDGFVAGERFAQDIGETVGLQN